MVEGDYVICTSPIKYGENEIIVGNRYEVVKTTDNKLYVKVRNEYGIPSIYHSDYFLLDVKFKRNTVIDGILK